MRAVRALNKREFPYGICMFPPEALPDDSVMEAIADSVYGVITMENHQSSGPRVRRGRKNGEEGLGKKLVRMGLNDTFSHGAGKAYLMRENGNDAMSS
jgi:transketolase